MIEMIQTLHVEILFWTAELDHGSVTGNKREATDSFPKESRSPRLDVWRSPGHTVSKADPGQILQKMLDEAIGVLALDCTLSHSNTNSQWSVTKLTTVSIGKAGVCVGVRAWLSTPNIQKNMIQLSA